MSETWIQIIFSGLLAWIAYELRSIKGELRTFVLREDCRDDMNGHCERIDKLEEKVDRNVQELEKLKGQAEIWHSK